MSRAAEGALDALHAAVADVLTEALKGREEVVGGVKVLVTPSPQMIGQAIKFLKDNGVDTPAKSKRMSDLASALADLDDLEAAAEMRPN